jgi:hypothetical protein
MAEKARPILASLLAVQRDLKAPKGQFNSFGKYKYRSCEDIVEAVKPLLNENGLILTMSDDVIEVGGRVYIKATATVTDIINGDKIEVTAMAREPEDKKGADTSQITGMASSYARKYSLNGLFAIDDTKDADTEEYAQNAQNAPQKTETTSKSKSTTTATKTQNKANDGVKAQAINKCLSEAKRLNLSQATIGSIASKHYSASCWIDMTAEQITEMAENLENWSKEK